MSRRKSSFAVGGGPGGMSRAARGSIMLSPQQRLSNFKQTVTTANANVAEKGQEVRTNIQKKLEKRKRRFINAQGLLQQLGELSGINDANLLYGEKPPVGGDASLMMVDKSYLHDTAHRKASGDGAGGMEQVKPKKDLRYKLKSFKRRAEQKVLEQFGKSPQRKAKETTFDTLWKKVSTQEQIWKELKDRCKELKTAMQTIGNIGSEISELLVELCKEEDSDVNAMEPQVHTLPLLKLQYSLDTISKDTIPKVLDQQLQEAVAEPLKEWRDEFPSYQACLQKRDGLARDVDAYKRKLVALEDKAIDRRDPAEIARRKDQLVRAERRFKNFNQVFIQHLKEVDCQKFEKGQIIGDGVLEAFRSWHDTCAQLLPPAYTFDAIRNTPRKDKGMSDNASVASGASDTSDTAGRGGERGNPLLQGAREGVVSLDVSQPSQPAGDVEDDDSSGMEE